MTLKLAAIIPHAPVLLETFEDKKLARKTVESFKQLKHSADLIRVEVIVFITPHGLSLADAAILNTAPDYRGDLEQFGDLTHRFKIKGTPELAQRFSEEAPRHLSLQQSTKESLDYGVTIPLIFLGELSPKKWLILHPPHNDLKISFELGHHLRDFCDKDNKQMAIFASVDLSARHSSDAPAGFSPKAKLFDKKIQEIVLKQKFSDILKIDQSLVDEAGSCGLAALAAFCGALEGLCDLEQIFSRYEIMESTGLLTHAFAVHFT